MTINYKFKYNKLLLYFKKDKEKAVISDLTLLLI